MKLITKELQKRFAQVGSQENVDDPICIARFFNPYGIGHWFATEYNPEENTIFGYASLFGDWSDEWGYTSIDELEANGIERDMYCDEVKMSTLIEQHTHAN